MQPTKPAAAPEFAADEQASVRLARQNDQTAWENLVRLHQEPVFRLAYLILGDAAEAEDAAQETFIRAYRALERFAAVAEGRNDRRRREVAHRG